MSMLRRPLPRRLSARLWLFTLPSALVSFERRSSVPRLPVGKLRFAGLALIAGGAALAVWGARRPGTTIALARAASPLPRSPLTLGGLAVLAGFALLLRSTILAVYSLGLVIASGTRAVEVEEPELGALFGGQEE